MIRFNPECNIQRLDAGAWRIEKKLPDLGHCRREVNRLLHSGYRVSHVSLFYHGDGAGSMEIFFCSGHVSEHLIAEIPFRSSEVMEATLRRWRSLSRRLPDMPVVTQFRPNGYGGYQKPDRKSWKW